jgi:hypothetical protein
MKHEKTLNISFCELLAWQEFLEKDGGDKSGTVKTFTANFYDCGEGEVSVDIKICDSRDGTPFIDAVMFQDGHDVGCLEVRDIIAGEYHFKQILKNDYVVIVPDSIAAARPMQIKYRAVEQWLQKLDEKALGVLDRITKADFQDFPVVDKTAAIDDILHRCENDDTVLEDMFHRSERTGLANPFNNLVSATIYVDKRGDRHCPSCQRPVEEEHLKAPELVHVRTTMRMEGYCPHCGCDYVFEYLLFVDNVSYK